MGLFVTPKTKGGLECPVAKFTHELSLKCDGREGRGVVKERVRLLGHKQPLRGGGRVLRQARGAVGLQRLDLGQRGWRGQRRRGRRVCGDRAHVRLLVRRVLGSLRHVGLEVTPESKVSAKSFVANVADEGLHGAQQLLVPLQLLGHRERLAALLAGPQAGVLAGRGCFGGGAGLGRLRLGLLHRLLFHLDFEGLRKAEVLGETGRVFRVEVHLLRAVAAARGVVFGRAHVVCLRGLGLGPGGARELPVVVQAGQGEVLGRRHGVLVVDLDLVSPDAEG